MCVCEQKNEQESQQKGKKTTMGETGYLNRHFSWKRERERAPLLDVRHCEEKILESFDVIYVQNRHHVILRDCQKTSERDEKERKLGKKPSSGVVFVWRALR